MKRALVKFLRRPFRLGPFTFERWHVATAVVCIPLITLNLAVAYFGNTTVFPLSPYFLENKVHALGSYALHRPVCAFMGHPEVDEVVAEAERAYGLPKGLMAAVVIVESARLPHRISPAGAMGPAQIIPSTAKDLDLNDPFDTRQSIFAGARYLSQNLKTFGSVTLAVAAYNAGPGGVIHRKVPRNGETEFYVQRVMSEYGRIRGKQRAESRAKGRVQSAKGIKR